MSDTVPAVVVVLAAGEGKRMKSATPKVLHPICGRTLLGHVLAATAPLDAERTIVVVGHGRAEVTAQLAEMEPTAVPVVQPEQRGTGHAVRLALESLDGSGPVDGIVVVVPGDAPLLTTATLQRMLERHAETSAVATVLTATMSDPTGYGRVVRDHDGHVTAIVEERDADAVTLQVAEINTSVYAFDATALRASLVRLTADNAQGEEYLTDVIGLLVDDGKTVTSAATTAPLEGLGVNDRVQLAAVRRAMRDRIVEHWMREGVTIVDPETTWMGIRVSLEPDVTIHQNTQLHGPTHIARGAEVGPDCTLRDTQVGAGATVIKSHCTGAVIGPDAKVGPYTYLRPGTVLGRGAKAGAHTELKNAIVGEDSSVPHLSYVGDAEIGARTNIGAATVFVNFDGVDKHRTVVGDDARVGSDTMLVAPVTVGDGAYTGAGSVITEDVPPGAMGLGRARQRNVEGWVERNRPGTGSAAAASRARDAQPSPEPTTGQATMEETSPSETTQGATE